MKKFLKKLVEFLNQFRNEEIYLDIIDKNGKVIRHERVYWED